MDGDTKLLLGLLGGAALAVVVLWALQNRNNGNGGQAGQPALVQHNVMRDEQGRIRQVETFRGMQNAMNPPARPQGPEPEPAMVEWADE